MKVRPARALAWGLWLLDIAGIVASLLFAVAANGAGRLVDLVTEMSFIGFVTVGALIVSQRLRNRIGWLLCAIGTGTAFTSFSYGYLVYADARGYTHDLFTVVVGLLGNVVWPLNLGLGMLLLLLFPTGKLPSPRWRVIGHGVIALVGFEAMSALITPGPVDPDMKVNNPLGVPAIVGMLSAIGNVGGALMVFVALATVASVILRYLRAQGIERQQIKWFAYSCALMVVVVVGASVVGALLHDDNMANLGFSAGFLLLPLGLGVAVLRHRLYDIDVIINRTLVYGSLTITLAGLYLIVVIGAQALTEAVAGTDIGSQPLVIVISTLLVAALFQPLRRRIQRTIDHRFYRAKYDAARTLEAFAATLRTEVELEGLTQHLLAAVDETMRPAHVSLWMRAEDGQEVTP